MSLTAMIQMKDKMYVDIETCGSDSNKVDIIFTRVKKLQGLLETLEEEATEAQVPLVRRVSMRIDDRSGFNQLSRESQVTPKASPPKLKEHKLKAEIKDQVNQLLAKRGRDVPWYHNFKALHAALRMYRRLAALAGIVGTVFAVAENEYLMQGGGQRDKIMNVLKAMNTLCSITCGLLILRMYYIDRIVELVSLHVHCFTERVRPPLCPSVPLHPLPLSRLVSISFASPLLTETCTRSPRWAGAGSSTRGCGWSSLLLSSTTLQPTAPRLVSDGRGAGAGDDELVSRRQPRRQYLRDMQRDRSLRLQSLPSLPLLAGPSRLDPLSVSQAPDPVRFPANEDWLVLCDQAYHAQVLCAAPPAA
eukprot:213598-Hanusia_phi.AAC.5